MKKIKFTNNKGFFSGKGFYIALAVSLIAISGATFIGINATLDKLNYDGPLDTKNIPSTVKQKELEWGYDEIQETAKSQSNIAFKSSSSANSVAPPKAKTTPPPSPKAAGFIMPIKGDIIASYSGENLVKSKTLDKWQMHTGMDIKAAIGTPVKSISTGTITDIYEDDMWGICVVISHPNKIESHYCSLKAITVKKNATVKLGDVIGAVGDTAEIEAAEEPHLHFAMKKDGEWVDPTSIIKNIK